MRRALVWLAVAGAAALLWVRNCSGPVPAVEGVRLLAPQVEAAPYRVEATVDNRGVGSGYVPPIFRLRDRASGRTVQQEKRVSLGRDEVVLVTAEITAPPASYEPEVEAHYPPRYP